tara:strand:+ start:76 stop:555 length:480 start_codon:yes stop_codon:yes gene_type:complete
MPLFHTIHDINPVELMQILGTGVAIFSGIPGIVENYNNRNEPPEKNPLNNISLVTLALMTFAGLGRIPNVIAGLHKAIYENNRDVILRFSVAIIGVIGATLVFFVTLIFVALYHSEETEEDKKKKKAAVIMSFITCILFIMILIYLFYGIIKNRRISVA